MRRLTDNRDENYVLRFYIHGVFPSLEKRAGGVEDGEITGVMFRIISTRIL